MGKLATVVSVAAVALSTVACDIAVSGLHDDRVVKEEKRFAVAGRPVVELQTFDGSIEVRAGGGSEVLVTIERRARTEEAAKALEVSTEQNGSHLSILAKKPDRTGGIHFGSSGSVSLVVTVPSAADVEARSGDGSIRIEGVSGTLKSHTGDGSIKLADVNGPVDVSSGDGSITVAGKMTAVQARSGDGSVEIEAAAGSTASSDWDVTTGDGAVTLRLPQPFDAQVDAHTGDGGIHADDVDLSHATGENSKNDLRGTLGHGGHTLRIRTGDGSITLKRD